MRNAKAGNKKDDRKKEQDEWKNISKNDSTARSGGSRPLQEKNTEIESLNRYELLTSDRAGKEDSDGTTDTRDADYLVEGRSTLDKRANG